VAALDFSHAHDILDFAQAPASSSVTAAASVTWVSCASSCFCSQTFANNVSQVNPEFWATAMDHINLLNLEAAFANSQFEFEHLLQTSKCHWKFSASSD
jgi:hypothetical protein